MNENPMIDRAGDDEREEPREEVESEEPIAKSYEDVFQNLSKMSGESDNFLESEAIKAGVDFDERDKGEPDPDNLRDERDL